MKNQIPIVSKASAIQLIQQAYSSGFRREIHVEKSGSDKRYAVMVVLSKRAERGCLFVWTHIYVSFRFGAKRQSVAIASQSDYQKESLRGLWNARYAMNYVNKEAARIEQKNQNTEMVTIPGDDS